MNDNRNTNSLELIVFGGENNFHLDKHVKSGTKDSNVKELKQYYPINYFLNDAREVYPKLESIRRYMKSELYNILIKDDEEMKDDINRKLFDEYIYRHFEDKYYLQGDSDVLENYRTFLYTVLSINNFKNVLINAGFIKTKYGIYYISRNLVKYLLSRFCSDLYDEKQILYPENYLQYVPNEKDRFEKYWMWEVDMK